MELTIRQEGVGDYASIDEVHDRAFGGRDEGEIVRLLRKTARFIPELSLVADWEGRVIGHILFYPIEIRGGNPPRETLALAPMAVLPEHQRRGVGSRMVWDGLEAARRLGYGSVIVLGHPAYYPRFGFRPASIWGIRPPFEAPDEAFMALELAEGGLSGSAGTVVYPEALAGA